MRKSLLALLAALALLAGACGASGGDDEADGTTTTEQTEGTTDDTTDTTEGSDEGSTTTTESDDPASGDLVDVEVWAEEFCGNFEAWLDGIQESGASVSEGMTQGDLAGAKTAIVGLFDDVAGQTETLIGQIEDGGAPDIDDGEDFLDDLVGKFEEFHAAIETARTEADAADPADPATFQTTITELVSTFQSETETVGNSFAELDAKYGDADLDAAVRDSCTFMG